MVLDELLSMPVRWQSKNEFELLFNEIGSKHVLRNTGRLTFNRNVMKRLDFVLELQNPYSMIVNVVVPLYNLIYSRIWLLIKGGCACAYESREW